MGVGAGTGTGVGVGKLPMHALQREWLPGGPCQFRGLGVARWVAWFETPRPKPTPGGGDVTEGLGRAWASKDESVRGPWALEGIDLK